MATAWLWAVYYLISYQIYNTYLFVFSVVQLTIEIKAIKKENPIRKLVLEFILG